MKRAAKYTLWLGTLLVLVGLACRLCWYVARTETGLETLRLQWRDATWGLVVGERAPIYSQEPAVQARLWLAEVDRVLHRHRNDAELTMGAALVLDSPSQQYVSKYLKKLETAPAAGGIPEFDEEGLKAAENAFETQCKKKCLALAAKATELDPNNAEWWQLRALLLWHCSVYSGDQTPRAGNWLEVLQEASTHDADNALYDYLAAYFYWESSAEVDFQGANERLVIKAPERFERGAICFAQGQKKSKFAVAEAGFSAVAAFLDDTTIPMTDREKIINDRLIHLRRSLLLRYIWRWQGLRASKAAAEGDVRKALAMRRDNLRMIDQYTGSSISTKYDDTALACRIATTYRMSHFVTKHAKLFPAAIIAEVEALEITARLEKEIVKQATREWAKNHPQRQIGITFAGNFAATVVGISLSLVVILLLVGLLGIGMAHIASDRAFPGIGAIGHCVSFAAALASTVVIFGLAPSEIIPSTVQVWVLTILVIATPIAFAAWIGKLWRHGRAIKFSLRTLLVCVFAFGVLFETIALTSPGTEAFAQFPFALSIPPHDWNGLPSESLARVCRPRSLWVVLQWIAYQGQYLTILVWAVLTALLLHFKLRRFFGEAGGVAFTFRDFLAAWARSFGHACLVLSVLLMILYLTFAPSVITTTERQFQDKVAFARHPSSYWAEVEQVVQRVRSDQQLIEQLRATAKAEIAREK